MILRDQALGPPFDPGGSGELADLRGLVRRADRVTGPWRSCGTVGCRLADQGAGALANWAGVAAVGHLRVAVVPGLAGAVGSAWVWLAAGQEHEGEEGNRAVHVVSLPPAVSIPMTLLFAVIYHMDLWITLGIVVTAGIIAWLWWLWRKFRVRRPPKKVPK